MKFWLPLCLSLLAAAGCEQAPPPAVVGGPKLVKVLKVGPAETAGGMRLSGEVRARYESTLGFRIGGKIVERLVDVGARVKAGQVLARLDPADARLAVSQAEASRALAVAELKRAQDLRARNFISQAALEAKETAAKAAEAQAGLARNQLAYTTLAADAEGIIAAVLAEPGQVVGAGQPVFRLARDGVREVAIAVPEARLAAVKVGSPATAELWAGQVYTGHVREVAPAADPATRTFAARVALDDAPPDLPLGASATVRFAAAREERIVVPLAALLQQGERMAVWVVGADDTVALRPVTVERFSDEGAVLEDGLAPGEEIVAAGAFRLSAGEKVRRAP